MHNKIYQITEQKLAKDRWIDEQTFIDYNIGDFADYVYNIESYEQTESLKYLDNMFEGIFKRKGRVLTYLGAEDFVNEWLIAFKDKVAEMDNQNFKDWMTSWNIQHILTDTHKGIDARFYLGEDMEATADPFGEFIRDVYANNKKGDKFYVGGIVGFHF
jgi:hypothetical protein